MRHALPAPVTPLSHHEILALVEPFTRAGRQVDLARSDRAARRLLFKPVVHPATEGLPPVTETLKLEDLGRPGACFWRLTRVLDLPDVPNAADAREVPATPDAGAGSPRAAVPAPLQATLQLDGATPAEGLQRVAAIAPARLVSAGPGWRLARQVHLEGPSPLTPGATAATPEAQSALAQAPLRLAQATAQLEGLRLLMKVSPVKGISGEIELDPVDGPLHELPDDLLAVLGWSWTRLVPRQHGWTTRLRLRGDGHRRSRDAEAKLMQAVQHLARTLSEPPPAFHDRQVGARWAVVGRRAIPLAGAVAMVIGAALFAKLEVDLAQDSVLRMLIFHAPPILMVLLFSLNELPRVELPPLPRRPRGLSWRRAGPG